MRLGYLGTISSIIMVAAILAACGSEPSTFAPNNTDSFTAYSSDDYKTPTAIVAADYLFSIDTSRSMRSYQSTLIDTIQSEFITQLNDSSLNIDYRVAVVEGTYQYPTKQSWFGSSFMGGGWASPGSLGSLDSILSYLGQDLNPNVPQLPEAAKVVMTGNRNFSRLGAQQVYIFVSDCGRADESPSNAASYASSLKSLKGSGEFVSARSIGTAANCALLTSTANKLNSDSDAAYTTSKSYAYSFSAARSSIAASLVSLAKDVSKKPGTFQLRGVPAEGTLHIFWTTAGVKSEKTSGFTFNAATNTVTFNPVPPSSTQVSFEYDIEYKLKKTPVEASLVVSIEGKAPMIKDVDWTYDGAKNRILFHGDARPLNGEKVNVTYEIQ